MVLHRDDSRFARKKGYTGIEHLNLSSLSIVLKHPGLPFSPSGQLGAIGEHNSSLAFPKGKRAPIGGDSERHRGLRGTDRERVAACQP
jgi:hypothetical protein